MGARRAATGAVAGRQMAAVNGTQPEAGRLAWRRAEEVADT